MHEACLKSLLSKTQTTQINAIENHAVTLLDHTPRFKYFTLHGNNHIQNLYKIVDMLCNSGLVLNQEQAFLLGCSICIHDLGMVIPLIDFDKDMLFFGNPQPTDPANLEHFIRNNHHELIYNYIDRHYDFLIAIGLTPSQCALLRDISRCHRIVDINETHGYIRSIGALLRVIDELDIYSSRAPASVLVDHFNEMDPSSCWHWLKHNICDDWMFGHNVTLEPAELSKIIFKIAVHPPNISSIPYWLTQVKRPIQRVLYDEGSARAIIESWNIQVVIKSSPEMSSAMNLGDVWFQIHDIALSAGRKVILCIDDEMRKLEDLFLPLMQDYHVIFSQNARDALDKIAATKIDFAIIDLQIGSGFQWTAEETQEFKMTGVKLCKEILEKYPKTKIGILTGSRHDISIAEKIEGLQFLLKKPIDPDIFEKEVNNVLTR